ncbi:efflux RND transporter periplasmic adaptor subunit [Yoonia litorea]|uniref:RND family efflux transporter, MFP subunit n=1 Tax=Yoonia litorea TaxID=1123755 RepID=A0A1I6N3Q5_9RHOB|nr:efflux RND transporter periplasmic adaptor subunit [Yoonia litorea]SFS22524.1 RND family efflux transporter, MFP subunit [Yoonia litorea]
MRLASALICLAATSVHAQERFDCIMDPSMVVEVGSAVDGLISEAFVTRGDDIAAGQLIARLDARVEEAALAYARELAESASPVEIARNRLELVQRELERAERLLETNLVADSVVEALVSRRSEAELELQQAENNQRLASLEQRRVEAQLAQHEIRSPIDGIVITRMMSPGEFVYSQAPVAQLAQVDPIHVEVFLPTEIYPQFAKGDVASVFPAAPIGGQYEATIIAIDRVFDAASDTFGVRLALPNPEGALPTGLDCEISFE